MDIGSFTEIRKSKNDVDYDAAGLMPHNIEAEQSLLGALLVQNRIAEDVGDILTADAFYDPLHGAIYREIIKLIENNRLADPVTMQSIVRTWPPISDGMEVWQYLGRLLTMAAIRTEVRNYARLIVDLADRRRVIGVAQEMLASALHDQADPPTPVLIETAERGLYDIAGRKSEGREAHLSDAVEQAVRSMTDAYERGGRIQGVQTGLIDIDRMMGGFVDSDLIILGGRPSMGKSSLALNIAYNVASDSVDSHGVVTPGGHVHFFSLEMSAAQLAGRLIADKSEIASDSLRRGSVNENELRTAIEGSRRVASANMTIDETGGISLASLMAKARRIKRKKDTKLLVIDYLQLMSGGGGKSSGNRVQEITEITTGLKALAKELDVPILALSQLSRQVEQRADKRPQLSDLRESGSIEQDADVVMFVYRDEYYVEREKPDMSDAIQYAEWNQRMDRARGKAEVIIGKQRHGPVGTVMLSFQSKFTRFGNLGGAHGT